MDLGIDRQALVPVVQQIVSAVAQWIRKDGVSPGTRLPSIRQVALDNLLSQSSVIEAFERMVAQGLLAPRQGSGFVVAQPPVSHEGHWYEGAERDWGAFADNPVGELKLGCGWLPDTWHESDDISYAIREVTRSDTAGLFNYSTPLGLPVLREQLLKHLTRVHIATSLDRILTTAGASHAQDLLIRTLLRAGDSVVVETPGYGNLYRQLAFQGVHLLEVPRTRGGPDLPALETLLQQHRPKCLFIHSLYHNPTGTSLGRAVAERLLELAHRDNFLIIEEDVYGDLQHASCTAFGAAPWRSRDLHRKFFQDPEQRVARGLPLCQRGDHRAVGQPQDVDRFRHFAVCRSSGRRAAGQWYVPQVGAALAQAAAHGNGRHVASAGGRRMGGVRRARRRHVVMGATGRE